MSWTKERKQAQQAACAASAIARRCKSCKRGAAMKLVDPHGATWACRYCHFVENRSDTNTAVGTAAA